jgi:hypothetical protein
MTRSPESLVRETLADPRRHLEPDPQLYSRVLDRARALRRRTAARWASACAAIATIAIIAVTVTVAGPAATPGPGPASPAATPEPPPGSTSPVTAVTGQVTDVARTQDALFLVESSPDLVLRIDPVSRRITGSARALAAGGGIAVDPAAGRLWVWSSHQHGSGIPMREYALPGLTPLRDLTLPGGDVFAGAMLDGTLWLTTQRGLYRVPAGAATAQQVPGVDRNAFGLATDSNRDRVIVAGDVVESIDAKTLRVTEGALAGLKASAAVVAGHVWVGGYGRSPRLVQLDPVTLQPIGTSPANENVGPGAVVWPGNGVVWVRHGGDEGLDCLDPADGRVMQSWPAVQGPVTSTGGTALAVHDSSPLWLTLNKQCAG